MIENEERLRSVNSNIQEIMEYLKNLDEGTIRWNPGVESWSIIQVAIHVCDAIPFWLKELDKVKNNSAENLGRGYFDQGRLIAISKENVDSTKTSDVIDELEELPNKVKEALDSLSKDELKTKEAIFIVDVEVVQHIEIHLHQIKRNLSDKAKHDFEQD